MVGRKGHTGMEDPGPGSNCVAMSNLFVNPTNIGVYCAVSIVLARDGGAYNTCFKKI